MAEHVAEVHDSRYRSAAFEIVSAENRGGDAAVRAKIARSAALYRHMSVKIRARLANPGATIP